jgi:molecular chaperone Hsp33
VPTSLGVGVLVDTDQSIRQAGGFIVQLMPGCEDEVVDRLEANLSGVRSVTDLLEDGMKPTDILEHVLDDLSYQELDAMPAEFHCGCNHERAARAVLALGRAELEDMISKGEPADVYCHFCGEHHRFETDELRGLLG